MNETKHIILIDDESEIHMSFEMMLFGSNYRKTSITDSDEAMRYVESKDKYDKPDLFIIDLMMGKISGIDIIRSIRSDRCFDNIPVILYTGYHEQIINQPQLLKKYKITCVLPKMIYKKDLFTKIDSVINSSS